METETLQVLEEAKGLFNKYAKHHNDKGDTEKRDTNINISDKLRNVIGLEKEKESQLKVLSQDLIDDCKRVRRYNEILQAKVNTFDGCMLLLNANQGYNTCSAAMREDPMHALESFINKEKK